MGFYAPAQLVRDPQEHGAEVQPVSLTNEAADKHHAIVIWPVLSPTYAGVSVPFASYVHPARISQTQKAALTDGLTC